MRLSRIFNDLSRAYLGQQDAFIRELTEHYSEEVVGTSSCKMTLASFFQRDLRCNRQFPYLFNKYILFIENGNSTTNNSFDWSIEIEDSNGTDISNDFSVYIPTGSGQKFFFSIFRDNWNTDAFKIKVTCNATLDGNQQTISLINHVSQLDRDVENLIGVSNGPPISILGNINTTLFITNHLRDYLGEVNKHYPHYTSVASGLVYNNLINFSSIFNNINSLLDLGTVNNRWDSLFNDVDLERNFETTSSTAPINCTPIGIASLKIPLIEMTIDAAQFGSDVNLENRINDGIGNREIEYKRYYLLSIFPKSSIKYTSKWLKTIRNNLQTEFEDSATSLSIQAIISDDLFFSKLLTFFHSGPISNFNVGIQYAIIKNHTNSPYIHNILSWWPLEFRIIEEIFNLTASETLWQYRRFFNKYYKQFNIDTNLRRAHFFSQVLQELSRNIRVPAEGFNYSALRLYRRNNTANGRRGPFRFFWNNPDSFQFGRIEAGDVAQINTILQSIGNTMAIAVQPAQQQAIANRAYANRIGNGNIASGDGWNYRGKGAIQLTGRSNYNSAQQTIDRVFPNSGIDILQRPNDILTPEGAILSAFAFWEFRNANTRADGGNTRTDADNVTNIVNPGTDATGRQDRFNNFQRVEPYFESSQYPFF